MKLRHRLSALAIVTVAALSWSLGIDAAVINGFGRILSASYSSTAPITSDDLISGYGSTKVTVLCYSNRAGTAKLQYVDPDANARDLTTALAFPASELVKIVQDNPVPRMRLIFTPTATTAGTIACDGFATQER